MPRWWWRSLPPVLALAAVTLLAEVLIRALGVRPVILPAPSVVLAALWEHRVRLWNATVTTAWPVLIGLALSIVAGVLLAVLLASARWVQRAFYPYAVFFQVVPVVAIAPLLVIWFGYGIRPIVAVVFIVSVFPVIANTLVGLMSVDPALRDLFQLYGAGRWTRFFKLSLPSALPAVFTGIRIASGLAVIGAIVADFSASTFKQDRLGLLLVGAQRDLNTPLMFAAIGCAAGLGLALFAAVGLASRWTLRHWHVSEQEPE